jgi:ATP-dependent Clp protease protease subunit
MARRKTPEIALIGEMNDEVIAPIIRELLEIKPGGEVTIYIDSGGGSVYSALAIATFIRMRKLKVTGIVLAECSSAAILVFAACERRYCNS